MQSIPLYQVIMSKNLRETCEYRWFQVCTDPEATRAVTDRKTDFITMWALTLSGVLTRRPSLSDIPTVAVSSLSLAACSSC